MTEEFLPPWESRCRAEAEAAISGDSQGDKTEDGRVEWTYYRDQLGSRATRTMYYYPDGSPILDDALLPATIKWAMLMEKNRTVSNTRTLYGERLSTVWLGLDHSFMETGPPLIFETMLFASDKEKIEGEDEYIKKHFPHDQLQLRYSTKSEAEDSHKKLKLQCLIPPRWRHFLLWTIGRDRTWAHYNDDDEGEW